MRINLTAAAVAAVQSPEKGQLDYWDKRVPGLVCASLKAVAKLGSRHTAIWGVCGE